MNIITEFAEENKHNPFQLPLYSPTDINNIMLKAKPIESLGPEEKVKEALNSKQKGNDLFNKSQCADACQEYITAISIASQLTKDATSNAIICSCLNNLLINIIGKGDFTGAIKFGKKVFL